MLDKVAVGLDTRWVNQGVTRMGNSTQSAAGVAAIHGRITPSHTPVTAGVGLAPV
jgi:hypothetical protein